MNAVDGLGLLQDAVILVRFCPETVGLSPKLIAKVHLAFPLDVALHLAPNTGSSCMRRDLLAYLSGEIVSAEAAEAASLMGRGELKCHLVSRQLPVICIEQPSIGG